MKKKIIQRVDWKHNFFVHENDLLTFLNTDEYFFSEFF